MTEEAKFPIAMPRFLTNLRALLEGAQLSAEHELLSAATATVEEHDYDRWDGGITGWALTLSVPMAVYSGLDAKTKEARERTIEESARRLLESFRHHGISFVRVAPQLLEADGAHNEEPDAERGYPSREAFLRARELVHVRILDSGGYGEIAIATHQHLQTRVAIKYFSPHPFNSDTADRRAKARERLLREGRLLAALRHPNVVRLIDLSKVCGDPVLILEYVEGETLDALRQKQGPMAANTAIAYVSQILQALTACHSARIVHRDVSPRNVVVDGSGRAVLIDFGLGVSQELLGEVRLTSQAPGTPGFRAPELDTNPLDARPSADIYSVGAVAAFLLSGRPPQLGVPFSCDDATPSLLAVVRRALEINPERRGTAAEMLNALQALVAPPAQRTPHPVATSDIPLPELRELLDIAEQEGSEDAELLARRFGASAATLLGRDDRTGLALLIVTARNEANTLRLRGSADDRRTYEEIMGALGRLLATASGALEMESSMVLGRFLEEASKRGWLTSEDYDAWRPGMVSGSGMRTAYKPTALGRRWLAAEASF